MSENSHFVCFGIKKFAKVNVMGLVVFFKQHVGYADLPFNLDCYMMNLR